MAVNTLLAPERVKYAVQVQWQNCAPYTRCFGDFERMAIKFQGSGGEWSFLGISGAKTFGGGGVGGWEQGSEGLKELLRKVFFFQGAGR